MFTDVYYRELTSEIGKQKSHLYIKGSILTQYSQTFPGIALKGPSFTCVNSRKVSSALCDVTNNTDTPILTLTNRWHHLQLHLLRVPCGCLLFVPFLTRYKKNASVFAGGTKQRAKHVRGLWIVFKQFHGFLDGWKMNLWNGSNIGALCYRVEVQNCRVQFCVASHWGFIDIDHTNM